MVYCGNNANSPQLNDDVQGTRHQCLKKGVGIGKNLPFDRDYSVEYNPIVDRQIYCGTKEQLPRGYAVFGSSAECLQKGVGIGKRMKYLESQHDIHPISPQIIIEECNKYIVLFIVLFALCVLILYYRKPKYVLYINKKIKWGKVISYSLSISIFITIILFLINKQC